MSTHQPAAPPRGTRPKNRRSLIVAAASDLFHRYGYERVAMSDVAAAVNVAPSALYRHFTGKPELLTASVVEEMGPLRRALAQQQTSDIDALTGQLVDASLQGSRLGVLWLREARTLPAEEYARLRSEVSATVRLVAGRLNELRPGLTSEDARLLSLCVCSTLCSTSTHADEFPRPHFKQVLREIIRTVARAEPAEPGVSDAPRDPARPEGIGLRPTGRRERLLDAAITLFADSGYAAVSMEDIGARAGITGPSVYHHFTSKQQLLAASLSRSDEWVRYEMYRALAHAHSPADALSLLLDSYVEFVARHSEHIDVLLTEARNLSEDDRARSKQSQWDYIGEWVTLAQTCDPALDGAQARLRVQAVLSVANDVARTARMRTLPGALETVKRFGIAIVLPSRGQ
ncbi:AcrR family transcriptional regulator [Lipingzhangella halophila]|uniref:AcrR family transcriptional regulator n=1 Tax=Lipingzhangella halophila TaxID=1783352 RepID=A0A7W7RGB9_9ACTN|nr:TetR/AcrR family transcriptional regulator [Lipingzhangella halophila]MBB4931476.1 AcrR family transcriptional regulator [Lipingzhangella halophila]